MAAIKSLSVVAKVVADAQEKTKQKGYHDHIEAALNDPGNLCIKESQLNNTEVKFDTRYVGKVRTSLHIFLCVKIIIGIGVRVDGACTSCCLIDCCHAINLSVFTEHILLVLRRVGRAIDVCTHNLHRIGT